MHLSSLTLKNVRQFDERTFEFQPGFNLLVGENGAGKTTILRGLLAALGGTQQLGRRPKLDDDDIRLRASHAEVIASIHTSSGHVENYSFRKALWERSRRLPRGRDLPLVLFYAANEATCSAMRVKRAQRIRDSKIDDSRGDQEFLYEMERMELARRKPESGERRFGNSQSVREFVERALSSFAPEVRRFYWRFEPYDCSLLPTGDMEKRPTLDVEVQRQARAVAMRFFQESWLPRRRRPYDWPDQAKVVLTPEPRERERGARYLPNLREIWKGMRTTSEARSLLRSCSLEVKLTPRIMIRRGIGPLSLSQLSDGEQRLFSLFVDIARQLSLQTPYNEIGRGEAVVLIDEIDVHLHPKWQRAVVPALEDLFRGCQFIATTHSPFIIQATNRQKVTAIDPTAPAVPLEGGNSIEDIAEDIQGVRVPQRSSRAEKLSAAAAEYFKLLKQLESRPQLARSEILLAAEKRYRDASEPFTSDPALHALLKVQSMEADRR